MRRDETQKTDSQLSIDFREGNELVMIQIREILRAGTVEVKSCTVVQYSGKVLKVCHLLIFTT